MKVVKELKAKSKEELAKALTEAEVALRTFRFNISGSKTKNVKEGANLKRRIARIKTLQNNHEVK